MPHREKAEARAALDDVARVERETRAASRWWPRYIIGMGVLAFALIVVVEVYVPRGAARFAATGVWAVAVVLLGWWAESHAVQPARGGRRLVVAMVVWFGAYLVLIGPLVRWQAGQSLAWWSLAAALMAVPFLVVAWRVRRAS